MKKYQQLLLAILSISSFSCFLVYKHEYNKLRYVLEVLNFFPASGISTASPPPCNRNTVFSKYAQISTQSPPAWQRISNTLYVYSAYWEKVRDKEYVKTFAVGVLNENLNYGCYLWYDSHPKPKMGQFSFSGIPYKSQDPVYSNKGYGKSKTKAFVFYCDAGSKSEKPTGVTFYKTNVNETFQGFLPVSSLKSDKPPVNSTGICVMPNPFPDFNRTTYTDFLNFHQIVGVNNFIIYGASDQYNLFSLIQMDNSYKINLTTLQWNYPFFGDIELMKVVAENDCLTRTMGLFENIVILEWNKLFVPRYLPTISGILNELGRDKKIYKFQFTTLLFCSEYEDDIKSNKSLSIIFKKTKYSISKFDMLVPVYRPYLRSGPTQKFGKDLVAVQQYSSCRNYKLKSGEKKSAKIDTSVFRFQNDFLNSRLLYV